MSSEAPAAPAEKGSRLRALTAELRELGSRLRAGGGPGKTEKQHQQGKLTARERVQLLLDPGQYAQEIGLLIAYDQYEGAAPAAGVVTVVGRIAGRDAVARAHRLPRGLGRREPALPGRRLPRAVRRGAHLLLQLDHAPLPARPAGRGRDGALRRGRRLSARALRHHR